MTKTQNVPDNTAIRVALWRALHVQFDPAPHLLNDEVGYNLIAPDESWRDRPDMHPQGTAPFRASIIARAKYIEDFVLEKNRANLINQYVILGAGLDTFAQRYEVNGLQVYEIEKSETQKWKINKLLEKGYKIPSWLKFVSVNFEDQNSWVDQLVKAGFNQQKPSIVTSIGVSMYLTREAILKTLTAMAKLHTGSVFLMTFMLPLEMVDHQDKPGYEMSLKGAARSGTPFISFFTPVEMMSLVKPLGFKKMTTIATSDMFPDYFLTRPDGLRPSTGEILLIAET